MTTALDPTPYEPRRSNKIQENAAVADGDTWEEKLVVCEALANKLVIRSYFRNVRTHQRVWDEPPSGASRIEPASAAARHDAEQELKTLQLAVPAADDGGAGSKKKKSSFFAAFKKKDSNNSKDQIQQQQQQPKSSRTFFGKKKSNNTATAKNLVRRDRDADEDLQRAISASMGLLGENNNNNNNNGGAGWSEDQEALDIAKAISMSMADAPPDLVAEQQLSQEDIFLQQALQASRDELYTTVADATPAPMMDFSASSVSQFDFQQSNQEDYDSDFFNLKMPAVVDHRKPPPSSSLCFDPYAPKETPLAVSAAATAASPEHQLRKMQEGQPQQRKGHRLYNKKTLHEEAGVL